MDNLIGPPTLRLYTYRAVCVNVVDGDTVDLVIDKGFNDTTTRRIRLVGIDTPERGQTGYQEAKDFVVSLILEKDCYLQSYKSEAFGRWLGEIFYEQDGEILSLNQSLLDFGYAVSY